MPLPKTKRFRVLRESPADANVAQGIGGVNKLQTPGLSPPVVATAQTRPRPKSAVQSRLMAAPSILLVHGAANGAWVWDAWRRHLGRLGWVVNVLDLRGHGRSLPIDLAQVTMEDYVADLSSVTRHIAAPPPPPPPPLPPPPPPPPGSPAAPRQRRCAARLPRPSGPSSTASTRTISR